MARVSHHQTLRRFFRRVLRWFLGPGPAATLLLALAAAGCAVGIGGGNDGSASRRGAFVDSKVDGLEFNAGGLIGTTDADGTFAYDPGTPVTFFVGGIVVGSGPGAAVMTPVSLVEVAKDETNGTVTNIARFLMTIDDDRDPSNGIQITDAVRTAARGLTVDFTKPASIFAGVNADALAALSAATTAGGGTVSDLAAQAHLHVTLLALLAGDYAGDYIGDDRGTWEISIDPDGNLAGSSLSSVNADAFDVTGTVETNGKLAFSAALGPQFTGTIAVDGTISNGAWQRLPTPGGFGDNTTSQFGTFTGARKK